ncbi:ABC transporter ATP-binding protein [uncultured Treponema sp.]|uniref:ABC transporter ATP-binding protein n=1 Tax=uncultured Treponema sp. TaxID=162155 RepID=UPI00259A281D|nr:ABC transporter ATP-binding protein [uncultured Treponema sp.]
MNAITVKNLSKTYGEHVAVDSLSFTVLKGSVFGLLGANGAGKSTSLECILGTKKMDCGEVFILGKNPVKSRTSVFEKTGVQFQEAKYQELIKVSELCENTSCVYKNPNDYKKLLSDFGIADKANSFVKDLSGGERQRLFIVLALIPNPEVVFLDELTTGLDARSRRDVWKILESLKKRGLSILLTSHFMDEVEALCDEILILKKGKTVFSGTVAQAKQESGKEKFEDAYLWFTEE